MVKRFFIISLLFIVFSHISLAQSLTDQQYINQLKYKRNKLELVTQKRLIDEKRSYGSKDINTVSYTWEAYTFSDTDVSTSNIERSEIKAVTEWHIYKGKVKKLNDVEFLRLVGDQEILAKIMKIDQARAQRLTIGNVFIGTGLLGMLGGAAFSAGQTVITLSGLVTTSGFFVSAFNLPPDHYIEPDYTQMKIDEYNIKLKRSLDLPINFD